jgi:Rieske Fe-S protein
VKACATSRRAFCAGCVAALACAALGAEAAPQAPGAPGEDPVKRTRETRSTIKPSELKDYRKEGRFFLLADERGIYALTAICTHNGCTVGTAGPEGFLCPCHESEYDRQGRVTEGPAKLPLRHLKVREPAPGAFLEVDVTATADPDERL